MTPLLKNRKYLALMSAQAVSNLGDWLYILALLVLVGFRWHGSPLLISLMMLCLTGPMVVLGPFTGVLADKWNRTTLMMISNVAMAVLVGAIPWLPQKWMLFVILLLVGAFESLFNPAESGKLKEIVPDSQMKSATSVNSSIQQLTKIIGPGISGFLVATLGSQSAFWIDSVSFLLSTLLLFFTGFRATTESSIRELADNEPSSEPSGPTRQRFFEGLRYIRKVRILLGGTLILTIALFLIQLTDAQIVTLVRLIPSAPPGLVGLIMGLSGGGGLLAALLVNLVKWKSTSRVMALGSIGIGLGLGACAVLVQIAAQTTGLNTPFMIAIAIGAILVGLCAGVVFIPFQTMAQQQTPANLSGRVFGTIGSLTTAAALLGPALGGFLVTAVGVVSGFLVTATLLVLMGVVALLLRHWLEPDLVGPTSDSVDTETTETSVDGKPLNA